MLDAKKVVLDVSELDTEFFFRRRPIAVPGDLRPGWRIGLLVLLLRRCCRHGRSSLTRLHVLSWGTRTEGNRSALRSLIARRLAPDALIVRFDPAVNRAVDFAIGERLIRRVDGGKVELDAGGIAFADEICSNKALLESEKAFMMEIGQRVSESLIDEMFGGKS